MNEVGPSGRQGPCWNQITPQYMPWGHSPARPPAPLVTFTAQLASQQPTLENPQTLSLLCKRKASHLSMPT